MQIDDRQSSKCKGWVSEEEEGREDDGYLQEVCGSNEKENQTIAMIRGGSYIDQEQAGQAIDSYTDFRHPPFRREVGKK